MVGGFGGVLLFKTPEAERCVVVCNGSRLLCAARDSHIVNRALAEKLPFDEPAERQTAQHRSALAHFDCLIGDLLAIDEQPHAVRFKDHRQVVRLAVGDVDAGANVIGFAARQVGGEGACARQREQLPVSSRGLGIARDEDVVAILLRQRGPALDRDRRVAILVAARGNQATAERRFGISGRFRRAARNSACLRFISAILRPRAGIAAVESLDQPVEPVEVVLQAGLGIQIGVIEDADRPRVAAAGDHLQQRQVEFARTQRQDLLALLLALVHHAVQIQAVQVRLHLLKQRFEAVEVVVAVVLVVDDADVRHVQRLEDRQLILRLAEPAAVVVEPDRAADFLRGLADRLQMGNFCGNALLLFVADFVGPPPPVTQSCVRTPFRLRTSRICFASAFKSPGNHHASRVTPCFFKAAISASNVGMCSARQS